MSKEKQASKNIGFNKEQIQSAFEKFDKDIREIREKCSNWDEFNEELLKEKPHMISTKVCKNLGLGRHFLNIAIKNEADYLIATCRRFSIFIPFGPIQSIIHLLAVPKVPLYNVVSMDPTRHGRLCSEMRAALLRVIVDILKPNSRPRKLYISMLKKAFAVDGIANIEIVKSEEKLDTKKIDPVEACREVGDRLDRYYANSKKGKLESNVVVTFHIHDTCSIGQTHLHGWINDPALITDNGVKLRPKNTPLNRIMPMLCKHRKVKYRHIRRPEVVVEEDLSSVML